MFSHRGCNCPYVDVLLFFISFFMWFNSYWIIFKYGWWMILVPDLVWFSILQPKIPCPTLIIFFIFQITYSSNNHRLGNNASGNKNFIIHIIDKIVNIKSYGVHDRTKVCRFFSCSNNQLHPVANYDWESFFLLCYGWGFVSNLIRS